jgi:hypothetical protein
MNRGNSKPLPSGIEVEEDGTTFLLTDWNSMSVLRLTVDDIGELFALAFKPSSPWEADV